MVRIGRVVAVSLTYELAEAKAASRTWRLHFPAASTLNRAEEPAMLPPLWFSGGVAARG